MHRFLYNNITLLKNFVVYKRSISISMASFVPSTTLFMQDTPALVVDDVLFRRNIDRMNYDMSTRFPTVSLRPHAKAHKSADVAHAQLTTAVRHHGVCVQKVSEAEAMVKGGILDVFLSNTVIGEGKLRRLVSLCTTSKAKVSLCVDSPLGIQQLSKSIEEVCNDDLSIDVLVEVNCGQNRCGVEPTEVVALCRLIDNTKGVRFRGIQCYNGLNQHIRDPKDRRAAVMTVVDIAKECLNYLTNTGISCDVVTGGGTGTYEYEAGSGVFTEVQPGSYIWMDNDYSLNKKDDQTKHFENSLFVLSTVHSISSRGWYVCDAGLKAVSYDSGPPGIVGPLGELLEVKSGGDEHGILLPKDGVDVTSIPLSIGDKILLIPGHCDPTVNLYDNFVVARFEKNNEEKYHVVDLAGTDIINIWPIARGPGY